VAFIDGGAIGLLDRRQRSALQAVLIAIVAQDAARLRDALRPMTTASKTIDERALGVVLVDHLVGGALRALTTLQHTLELLGPDFDLIAEAKTIWAGAGQSTVGGHAVGFGA
jgi:hypothetical protein